MIKATAHLESVSPYSPSRMHATEKTEKERPDDYESRRWRTATFSAPRATASRPSAATFPLSPR